MAQWFQVVASLDVLRAYFFYTMAKRFTDTDKWKDDWFISLSNDYRIIWQWLVDNCDHAGICKPSIGMINLLCKTDITEEELIEKMNGRVLKVDGYWFIPKFLKFQYKNLNSGKPAIISVIKLLKDNKLDKIVNKLYGNDYIMIKESLPNDYVIIKDKVKDMDKDKDKDDIKNSIGEGAWIIEKNNFLNDFRWSEKFCRDKNCSKIVFDQKINDFVNEIELRNECKTKKELQSHFVNWFKKNNTSNGKSLSAVSNERMDATFQYANRYTQKDGTGQEGF